MNELTTAVNDAPPAALRFAPDKPRSLRTWVNDRGMQAAGSLGVGLSRLLGSRAGGALGIITYHRVSRHVPGLPPPLHNVTPERFRAQLGGLLSRRFTVWPLRHVLEHRRQGREVPPRTVVVTFDDGFEAVYHNAFPVLRELKIPATVFVNTAYLDTDTPFPFDAWGVAWQRWAPAKSYRPLRSGQCREMLASGWVELGAHTHTHQDFRRRPDDFCQDLQTNVEMLRALFDLDEVTFAFPYGSRARGFAGGELAVAARQAGVRCALTTEAVLVDLHSDPFRWGRFNVFPWDSSATLAAKLEGWYSWSPRLRQWLGRVLRCGGPRPGAARGESAPRVDPA